MKKINKKCLQCGKKFDAPLTEHNRGNAKFCSRSCSSTHQQASRKPEPNCTCHQCGTKFHKPPSRMKNSKSGLSFCSRRCKDKAQRIGGTPQIQPPHYGKTCGKNTYRKKAFRELQNKCNRCGYKKHLKILVVHHRDEDRKNNSIKNLEILCPNCHAVEHYI